jgi:hypothetical protein
MRNQSWKGLGAALLLVAVPGIAVIVGQSQRAAAADEEADGRIVAISPDEGDQLTEAEQAREELAVAPKYWIGLQGRPIDSAALRTHLQLADDVGVLVENVVPDSPAAKAGLRQYDVIVAVNGEPISDLTAVQKVVADGAKKAIDLKVIRLAKESNVEVTPEERPADLALSMPADGGVGQGFGGQMPDVEAMLRQLQQGGAPGGMRVFGPGMIGGQAFNLNQMPSGVSVSVARQDEGPAEITVKKGEETWTLKSDDEEAIKKLPEDVRPFVEQMLDGSQPGMPGAMRFNLGDLQQILPDQLGKLDAEGAVDRPALRNRAAAVQQRTEEASERLLERMEQMEQRIRDLQRQLEENSSAPRTNEEADPSKT